MSPERCLRPPVPRLLLFGTQGCHLCEEAAFMIGAAVPVSRDWQALDIVDDPALLHRYGTRIPVLRHEASGDELEWPFDAGEVRIFLTAHGD